ncbi:MAG: FtsX-like permease family protein [Vulcanimicrobiaceae bacterium]
MIGLWLRGIVGRLGGRLVAAIVGVALTVALIGALGAQIASSAGTMTRQAIADVGVDWQVQLTHGTDSAAVLAAIAHATATTERKRVWFATVSGFSANLKGSTQTTGAGKVVGLQAGYFSAFPAEVRWNVGRHGGVLLFQQTAANLHAAVGDTISVRRIGLPPAHVRVDGIVAMPNIDAFFQAVGLPAGAAPQAPPDNVVLMPEHQWHAMFDRQSVVRPNSTVEQFHVRLAHDRLPSDPLAAYTAVTGKASNVEAQVAGSAIIGDNLAAKLLGAQADALYARVLFVFLGLPGVILAALLTFAVAASGASRRAGEQALLRVRGASSGQLLQFAMVEAIVVGIGGVVLGIAIDLAIAFTLAAGHRAWVATAAAIGFVLALAAVLIPAWLTARTTTVAAARRAVGRSGTALWERLFLDLILLAIGALVYLKTASSGYQIVLAPEGVPQATVHYDAFLAPLLLWIGAALLAARLWRLALVRGRSTVALVLSGLAGRLGGVVAATLSRQHRLVTRGMLLAGLAVAFGVSTAVFNATFAAQSRVDAQLTNGADVAVTGLAGAPPSRDLAKLRAIPGVVAAVPMQHRYAYVGADLQDLYGIDPRTIGTVTPMSNAFFGNNDAAATLAALERTPDGVLVSEETVKTYQLHLGDPLTLRLQDARTHAYVPVKFHFIGITREFPTAPKDSFLVANSAYIAQRTGSAAAEVVLLRAQPGAIASVAAAAAQVVANLPGATVSDIVQVERHVGSSITSVDLHSLTRIELLFAVIFVAAATGLMLALGFAERLRTFAVLAAVGAKGAQLRSFLIGEAVAVVAVGAIFGIALGFTIAEVLVKLLTGVFDPPPAALTVPWGYLVGLVVAAGLSTAIAVAVIARVTQTSVVSALRGL